MNDQIRYYQLRAKEYDTIYQKPERQKDLALIRQYLSQQFSGKELLEIACGTGYWTQVLSTSARKILATDINPAVLAIAQEKDYPQQNVEFHIQDIYQLNPADSSFEGLFGGFILSHVDRAYWEIFFIQCLAQLTAGAEFIFLDNKYVPGSSSPISRKDHHGNTYQERKLVSGEVFEVMKNFPSESDLQPALLEQVTAWEWIEWEYYWLLKCKK
ncbi:MAG: class I SAM-dependent methyltransferase [Saprospiraceae bacterium]|nr:class I SAM-dependent methyltransferase [Saprospiraceae bacterium]